MTGTMGIVSIIAGERRQHGMEGAASEVLVAFPGWGIKAKR